MSPRAIDKARAHDRVWARAMSINPTDQEDAYFRKQDQELRQKLRDQLDAAAGGLAGQTDKLTIAQRIQALGFAGAKAQVFDLLPLIHVAWADGSVSRQERTAILDIVKDRGFDHESEPYIMVSTLLETRPSDEFLNQSLDILRVAVGDARAENIVEMCLQIANASGGFMNIGKVSGEEKARIAAIAEALGPAARDAFHRELG